MFFADALGLFLQLALPLLGGAVAGALIGGLIASAIRLEDRLLTFMGGLFGLLLVMYFAGGYLTSAMTEFAIRIWGGADMYR